MSQQHLCLAQEQKSLVLQGKVEVGQHALLNFGIEVHESISTDEKVQTRNRSVLDLVIPAEYDTPTTVSVKRVPASRSAEISLEQRFRHVSDCAPVVAALSGHGQRVLRLAGALDRHAPPT